MVHSSRFPDNSIITVYVKRHAVPPIPIPAAAVESEKMLKLPIIDALEEISLYIDHQLKEGGVEDWLFPKKATQSD